MAANPNRPRERRPAIWPWLLMPAVVLAVFFALNRVHHRQATSAAAPAAVASEGGTPRQL
jgi:hypothetical protein